MDTQQIPTDQNPKVNEVPSQQSDSNNSRLFLVVAVSVLFTAVLAGSAVYFWQKAVNEREVSALKQKLASLEEQISAMNKAKVTPQPQLPPSDSTENWKAYQDEDVTFKYPSQWIEEPILIRGSGFTQEFRDPEGKFSLTFLGNGNYNQTTGKPYTSLDELYKHAYKAKAVTVGGQEGRQPLPRAGSENINSIVFFSKDSKFIYTLELQTGSTAFGDTPSDTSEADVEEGQKLFDQIISTFRFTN